MWLHVGGICAVDLFNSVNRKLLCHINVFATTVIALTWVALGIFICELGTLGLQNSGGGVVFAGDEFDMVFLTGVFSLNSGPNFRVGLLDQDIAVVHEK